MFVRSERRVFPSGPWRSAEGRSNTTPQIGVAHALLVSQGTFPHVIAGISTGAVNAAAVAEILQTDDPTASETNDTASGTVERFQLRQ